MSGRIGGILTKEDLKLNVLVIAKKYNLPLNEAYNLRFKEVKKWHSSLKVFLRFLDIIEKSV